MQTAAGEFISRELTVHGDRIWQIKKPNLAKSHDIIEYIATRVYLYHAYTALIATVAIASSA